MPSAIPSTADVVICGAGLAGIASAYYLKQHGVDKIILIDQDPPLNRTSSRSAECYRDWWSEKCMFELVSHSISLMEVLAEKSGNQFNMNRRGYLYVSFQPDGPERHQHDYKIKVAAGMKGDFRIHQNSGTYRVDQPSLHEQTPGVDWLLGEAAAAEYPYLSDNVTSIIHARRCGWLSAQQLGMYMLEESGAEFIHGIVTGFSKDHKGVKDVHVMYNGSTGTISTRRFVNAAGPWSGDIAKLLGVELPIKNILHEKIIFNDIEGILPRDAPMIVSSDSLPVEIRGENGKRELMQVRRANGTYIRPEGMGQAILVGWGYHEKLVEEALWPPDPYYHIEFREVALNAAAKIVKGFEFYVERLDKLGAHFWGCSPHDGGYFSETEDNGYIVLVGPLAVPGTFTISGLSGTGVMSSCAVGELAALWACDKKSPGFADYLTPENWHRMGGRRSMVHSGRDRI